ncbi:6-chlorohydroxyquinol-1,2-dioxygenase [Mycolicibacterium peregrinum]|uniref:dioxygenase family protein n=1 Tax=Mycolicibacterium peregrinum TaxID=43304 RepID=UPI0006D7E742|nr:dioxygenase [Mycolicibacterium peregrinum]MCV7203820.1 6-chlorohydroxyquinol-1,2-dioxygenase [Mycolicibacterium peregrinum]ORW58191.1 6-chlorohydroxyquinol-1,2-dioxygenase [Mycolicibacterium peregrinum]OWM10445.1 6-chlorohydroxyquinol-1,2-dioxygenase [Mycolicibacterium peregrinum]
MDFTEEQSAEVVLASLENTPDPRLKQVMQGAVRHLHDFVREIRPTQAEWETAIDFLTAVGQACTDTRQEFILLSDTLGVSMLVETMNGGHLPEGDALRPTAQTVLGPFHMTISPERQLGELINATGRGEPLVVEGRVTDPNGNVIAGARVETWHADGEGLYDVQDEIGIPAGTGRGLFTANDDGDFWFRTVMPRYYPIPVDGPAGALVLREAREPYRPAHLHFIVEAEGYQSVTTHVFVSDCQYIERDVVFAVKSDLIRDFVTVDDPQEAKRFGVTSPFRHVRFDVVLAAEVS